MKIALLLIIFMPVLSMGQLAFKDSSIVHYEIFRVNHDSTEITFAGQKYVKKKPDMKNNNGIITVFYPDGSIKSVSKDGISVFRQDVNRNVGIGRNIGIGCNGGHDASLNINSEIHSFKSTGDTLYGKIFSSDSTIHVEKDIQIGNSLPMKKLDVSIKRRADE